MTKLLHMPAPESVFGGDPAELDNPLKSLIDQELERLRPLLEGLLYQLDRVSGQFGSGPQRYSYHKSESPSMSRQVLYWENKFQHIGRTAHVIVNEIYPAGEFAGREYAMMLEGAGFIISRESRGRNYRSIFLHRDSPMPGVTIIESGSEFEIQRPAGEQLLLPIADQQNLSSNSKFINWMNVRNDYTDLTGVLTRLSESTWQRNFSGRLE